MNTTVAGLKMLQAGSGLKWDTGKFRVYAIDMNYSGPEHLSRKLTNYAYNNVYLYSTAEKQAITRLRTLAPHGLTIGQSVAIAHVPNEPAANFINKRYYFGDVVKVDATTAYRCVVPGVSSAAVASWTGKFVSQPGIPTLWWMKEDFRGVDNPLNTRNWTVRSVESDTDFSLEVAHYPTQVTSGYVIPTNITYLSDIAPEEVNHYAMSAPLTGKVVTATGITSNAPVMSLVQGELEIHEGHILLLVRTAESSASDDLSYDEQVVIAMWTYSPAYLPLINAQSNVPALSLVI